MLRSTKITIFHIIMLFCIIICFNLGLLLGYKYFGLFGGIVFSLIGVYFGILIGNIPNKIATDFMFKEIEKSSINDLKNILEMNYWNFYQTLSLLQLSARGENVNPYLNRILGMLESNDYLTRVYGWDALRLVFPEISKQITEYNPENSKEICCSKLKNLKSA